MIHGTLSIDTHAKMELVDITTNIIDIVVGSAVSSGICYIFNPHTTAGITINEGADPDVKSDILLGLSRMVPSSLDYKHQEGNSTAHIMSSLIGCSLMVNIIDSKLQLGTWQKIFFCEFDGPRARKLHWKINRD